MAFNRSLRLRASSSRLPSTAAILTFENPQSLMGFTRASWEIFWPVKIWRMSGNQNTWKLRTSFPPTSNIYSKKIYELVAEDIQNGFKWYSYSGKYSCGKATWKQQFDWSVYLVATVAISLFSWNKRQMYFFKTWFYFKGLY